MHQKNIHQLKDYYIKLIHQKDAENERNFDSMRKVIEVKFKKDLETLKLENKTLLAEREFKKSEFQAEKVKQQL